MAKVLETVSIKAVEGRKAFTAAKGGVRIPHDKYIEVERTTWIERLINVHQDVTVEPVVASKKSKSGAGESASVL
jgi:hypothetical protein